jgi:hypothetical protein
MAELLAELPDRLWYLTQNGRDMWCRRPYTFFFSTSEAATTFAARVAPELELAPIGIGATALLSEDGVQALRGMSILRIFVDPQVDGATGDVHGRVIRLGAVN